MKSYSIQARNRARRHERITAIMVVSFIIFAILYTGGSDYQTQIELQAVYSNP
jgi:hypothetical protein